MERCGLGRGERVVHRNGFCHVNTQQHSTATRMSASAPLRIAHDWYQVGRAACTTCILHELSACAPCGADGQSGCGDGDGQGDPSREGPGAVLRVRPQRQHRSARRRHLQVCSTFVCLSLFLHANWSVLDCLCMPRRHRLRTAWSWICGTRSCPLSPCSSAFPQRCALYR